MEAQLSTLCYLERDGKYLMLHRVVKKNDINKDKWIGVGGHFEKDESPDECLMREVREETGYTLTSYRFRGIVTFVSGDGTTEYMHLFTADGFEGEPIECDEGVLEWVPKEKIDDLNIWEGDKIFFRLLTQDEPFFSLKLVYDGAGGLIGASLNGTPMPLNAGTEKEGEQPEAAQEPAGEEKNEQPEAVQVPAGEEENEQSEAAQEPAGEEDHKRLPSGKILKTAALAVVAIVVAAALFWNKGVVNGTSAELPKTVVSSGPAALERVKKDAQALEKLALSADTDIYTQKELILVNPWHLLPESYEAELENVEYGHRVDECAASHLRDMMADCRAEGHSPLICSSYRETSKQVSLFNSDVRKFMYSGYSEEDAIEETAKNVAVPGSSEHEAGLAVDIVSAGHQMLDEHQEDNETQQWLMEHCQEYGFILRYPRGKQDITGITYEPWHYRYVGIEAAEEIMSRGICLEEYLGVIDDSESFLPLDTDEW